jgi:hypothetical protein
VGDVANTFAPVPVLSVNAAARFALDGVARNEATLAARPDTPVDTGRPVQLVSVPLVGVPKIGVTNVGEVLSTVFPDPVEVVTPVPPLATGSAVPDKDTASVPVEVIGEPVTDKNEGTVIATDVTVPVPVGRLCHVAAVPLVATSTCPVVGAVALLTDTIPVADLRPLADVAVVADAALPVVFWLSVGNVQLDKLPLDGVPKTGVISVGELLSTTSPVPVVVGAVELPVPPCATDSGVVSPDNDLMSLFAPVDSSILAACSYRTASPAAVPLARPDIF